ncbi:SET and MYND domain-containing protein 4-like isoform X2 [Leptopilina boulardi]|uniref:SET and MYND domain-containing protein 4-like isoform X2 n=1 Tax=Leptopilina boulardi TaxID=63433 RepID=UPI0021F62D0A|nr:SET and MYND domain-containing protein 4-like isoform X2 [Leptopilina boulardi]
MFNSRRSTNEKSKIRIHQISFGDSRLYEKISKRSIIKKMSPLRDKLSEFFKSVNNAASNESFGNEFCKLSFKGNRRRMIEMLIELPEIKNILIEKFYHNKDDNLACNLYKQILNLNDQLEEEDKINLLINALFKSSYKSRTFFNILMHLSQKLYKLGNIIKCLEYCKYFKNLDNYPNETNFIDEFRIEFLLIESECYKKLGFHENSKICLNDAMRKVNEFITEKYGSECEKFKDEKLSFLKPIFERMNSMKLCRISKNVDDFSKMKDKKIPQIEGKSNEKLKSCSDAISLGCNETKGRFLFATRRIKCGTILIVDQPFAFSTDENALERNCLNCHTSLKLNENIRIPCKNCQTVSYCSEFCREESWHKYHKYECEIFNYFFNIQEKELEKSSRLLLAYRTTISNVLTASGSLNREFFDYHSQNNEEKLNTEIYDPMDYKTIYSLETNCSKFDPKENFQLALRSIFLAKLFEFVIRENNPKISLTQEEIILLSIGNFRHLQAISCNAYEIVENIRNNISKVIEPQNIGGAIYSTVSLTNHSCYPNIIRHSYPCGTVVVTALRTIEKGAEILDCYGPHFLKDTRTIRKDQLQKKFHFDCNCEACTLDWKIPLSDKIDLKCCSNSKINMEKCSKCKRDMRKIRRQFEESKKKKLTAITKMYNGNYIEALPILLEHSNFIENIFNVPNLEIIKTQQSIIQCLNSMSCTSVE